MQAAVDGPLLGPLASGLPAHAIVGLLLAATVGCLLWRTTADGWAATLAALVMLPSLVLWPAGGACNVPVVLPPAAQLLGACFPDLVAPHGELARALLGSAQASPASILILGVPGGLLAGSGLLCAAGRLAWLARIAVAVGFAGLGCAASLPAWAAPAARLLLLAGLGLAAGAGLHALRARRAEAGAMSLAWVSVALTGVLAVAALRAGARPDDLALVPWLAEDAPLPRDPVELHALAQQLRVTLDRSALAAAAAMGALLVFLRARGAAGSALLVGAAVADAARPWWQG